MATIRRSGWVFPCAVLAVFAACPAARGEPGAGGAAGRFTPSFRAGESHTVLYAEQHTTINRGEMMQGGESRQVISVNIRARVRTVEAGEAGALVEVVYERVRFDVQSTIMREPPSFDTAAPAEEAVENPFAPVLLALVNRPMVLDVGPDGAVRVVRAEGIEVPEVAHAALGQMLVSERWILPRFWRLFSVQAPEGEVTAWTGVEEVPAAYGAQQNLRLTTAYTVEGPGGPGTQIALVSDAELLPQTGGSKPLNMRLAGFESSGHALWDPAEGLPRAWDLSGAWTVHISPGGEFDITTQTVRRVQIYRQPTGPAGER